MNLSLRKIGVMLGFYISAVQILLWLARIGLGVLAIALITAIFSTKVSFILTVIGLALILTFPLLSGGITFRQLDSNRQLRLAPDLTQHAAYALLLLCLLNALTLPVHALLFNYQYPPLLPVRIFVLVSIFIACFQLNPPKYVAPFLWILPWLLMITWDYLSEVQRSFFLHPLVTLAYTLLTILGWLRAFSRLRRRQTPASVIPLSRLNNTDYSATNFGAFLSPVSGLSSHYSPEDSVLNNNLTNWSTRLVKTLFLVVGIPLIADIAIFIVGDPSEDMLFSGLFIFISVFPACLFMYKYLEILPRSRLLWIKMGSSREEIWNMIEKNILKDLKALYLVCFIISALVMFTPVRISSLGVYLLTILSCSIFYTYSSIYLQVRPSLVRTLCGAVCLIISTGAFLICIIIAFTQFYEPPILWLNLFLLTTGLVLRRLCRLDFLKIDWIKVKPKKLNRNRIELKS